MSLLVRALCPPIRGAPPSHHGSHRQLLTQATPRRNTRWAVDAIVVPTARPGVNLRHAVALATKLRCTLLVLCSREASTGAIARELARRKPVDLIVVDVDEIPLGLTPSFATSALLVGTRFWRSQDVALKRNLGLLFAAAAGWQRILFLDDDILIPKVRDLSCAADLLSQYAAVGLSQSGFPDNSVVCHAYRDCGGLQDTFVGGGALAVSTASVESFFPDIYNEDWFFLLDGNGLRSTAVTGRAIQAAYDPYTNPARARSEEFGDCLAEGLFWLLDRGRQVKDANRFYWRKYLEIRRQFIDDVMRMIRVGSLAPELKSRMVLSLEAALEWSGLIEPRLCVEFLRTWRDDSRLWQRHLAGFRSKSRLDSQKVLSEFGLMGCTEYVPGNR